MVVSVIRLKKGHVNGIRLLSYYIFIIIISELTFYTGTYYILLYQILNYASCSYVNYSINRRERSAAMYFENYLHVNCV